MRTSGSFQGTAPATRRLEVGNRSRGDRAGTADPNWWKGCSIQDNVMLSSKTGAAEEEGDRRDGFQRWPLLRHCLGTTLLVGGGDRLPLHYLLGFSPSSLDLLNCLYLGSWVFWVLLLLVSALPCFGLSERAAVRVLARATPPHRPFWKVVLASRMQFCLGKDIQGAPAKTSLRYLFWVLSPLFVIAQKRNIWTLTMWQNF